ncbi:MAG TPA: fibronectin type III domain-containing protein [Geothrix sp.]|nr:fibronectin type III domain-containing protein [Geothrix sp.]
MRLPILFTLALGLLFVACGGSGGGNDGGQNSIPAPTGLHIVQEPDPETFSLVWNPPQGTVDGYNLEMKSGTNSFTKINSVLIPSTYTRLTLTFSPIAPEDTDFNFRMNSAKGTGTSAYSNTAVVHHGIYAPGQPTGTYDWDRLGVALNWSRNSTASDGLIVERMASDSLGNSQGGWISLPVSDPLASTYLDSTATLGTYYLYRITNKKGDTPSAAGPASYPIYTGLVGPSYLAAYWDYAQTGVTLNWYASNPADSILLERAQCDASGNPVEGWATVGTFAGNVTTYTDHAYQELATYLYRATEIRLKAASSPVTSYPVTTYLNAPTDLVATPVQGGIQLTWTNRSQVATQVTLNRGGANSLSPIAVLTAGSTSYLDPNPPLGYYYYQVVAQNGYNTAASGTVMAATPNPPGALALTGTTLTYPQANDAWLGPAGTWAFLLQQPFGVLSNNDAWQPFFPNNSVGSATSAIQVDAKGWPHVVYFVADPQNNQNRLLTHIWTDGNSWQSEVIGQTNLPNWLPNSVYSFRLDSSGTPQVLLDHSDSLNPYGGSTATLTFVHKVNGAWVSDSLASVNPAISNIGVFRLVLDGADRPHFLLGNWSSISECSPDGTGGWISAFLPAGTVNAGAYDPLDGVWTDADTASVFYESPGNPGPSLMVLQKVAGVWQNPLQLGSRDYYGSDSKMQAAASPDHSRVAISYSTSVGVKTYHWNGTSWIETLVAPPLTSTSWIRLGFDAKNKVHLITYVDTYPFAGYMEYKEQ